jgi:cytochrome bd-type quinol oxidase subunit 2
MRRTLPLPHVPDYESRDTARRRVSKLAVASFILALLASPLTWRYVPREVRRGVERVSRVGIFALPLAAALNLGLALVALSRLRRRHASLYGMVFVAAAIVVSGLTVLLFVAVFAIGLGPGD